MAGKGSTSAIIMEMAGTLGGLVQRVDDIAKDVAELTRLQAAQNGNVAKNTQGLTEALAWQKAHAADHKGVADEREEKSRQRIEIFRAAPPYLTWGLNLAVIVLLLTGVNVPTAVARIVDVPVLVASPQPPPVNAPTVTVTPSATPSITPSPAPRPTATPRAGEDDRAALSRLCWVEARGAGRVKADACLSVISTVLLRAEREVFSDGTVFGTLVYNCKPKQMECAFPAYTALGGCDGLLLTHCPDNSPSELAYFAAVVDAFFDKGVRGSCQHYLYYGSRPIDRPECQVGGLKFFDRMK